MVYSILNKKPNDEQPNGHFQRLVIMRRTEADDHRDRILATLRRRPATTRQLSSMLFLGDRTVLTHCQDLAERGLIAQDEEWIWRVL